MDRLLYWFALTLVKIIQALPLRMVARLGRAGGAVALILDRRHRAVALANLTRCFQAEKSPAEIRSLLREHFCRLGENYACAICTFGMSEHEIRGCLDMTGADGGPLPAIASRGFVAATGHFGNFELQARLCIWLPGFRMVATYRGLNQPAFNRILLAQRQRSGTLFFDRRSDGEGLRRAMQDEKIILGLLADQHARGGLWVPFFGRPCATGSSPAVLAQRYRRPLLPMFCFRTALGRWRLEIWDEIPVFRDGERRSPVEIMTEVNAAYERAIRRDPANWFWVHRRWRPPKPVAPAAAPLPNSSEPAPEPAEP